MEKRGLQVQGLNLNDKIKRQYFDKKQNLTIVGKYNNTGHPTVRI